MSGEHSERYSKREFQTERAQKQILLCGSGMQLVEMNQFFLWHSPCEQLNGVNLIRVTSVHNFVHCENTNNCLYEEI